MTVAGSPTTYRATIESLESVSASVFYCRLTADTPVSYQPGQYAMVNVGSTARAYSFVTPPATTTVEWLIDTKPNGPASHFFRETRAGESVSFTAPYGDFLLDPADLRPLLYIAGGTGVAPIMAHLLSLLETPLVRPLTLIAGHRSHADMFWRQKLELLAAAHAFTYHGVVGPFQNLLPTLPNLPDHTVYICGSAGMCTATAETLYALGVSPAHVHYELFT
jgi:benzoate/toluate 1,2-dioxygenase reductase component